MTDEETIPQVAAVEAEAEEVVAAKALLKASGYLLVPYGRARLWVKWVWRVALRRVKLWKLSLTGKIAEKQAEMAAKHCEAAQSMPPPAATDGFCDSCGAPLVVGAKFCRKCGARVAENQSSNGGGK